MTARIGRNVITQMNPMKMMIPISAFLLILQGVAKLLEDFIIVFNGEEVSSNE